MGNVPAVVTMSTQGNVLDSHSKISKMGGANAGPASVSTIVLASTAGKTKIGSGNGQQTASKSIQVVDTVANVSGNSVGKSV